MQITTFKTKLVALVNGTTAAAVALDEVQGSEVTKKDLGLATNPTTHPTWKMVSGDWHLGVADSRASLNLSAQNLQDLSTGTKILTSFRGGLIVADPGSGTPFRFRFFRTVAPDQGQGPQILSIFG